MTLGPPESPTEYKMPEPSFATSKKLAKITDLKAFETWSGTEKMIQEVASVLVWQKRSNSNVAEPITLEQPRNMRGQKRYILSIFSPRIKNPLQVSELIVEPNFVATTRSPETTSGVIQSHIATRLRDTVVIISLKWTSVIPTHPLSKEQVNAILNQCKTVAFPAVLAKQISGKLL
mmetsp:Transcript_3714/g.7103  ORF Transcript_3714/g.7103 Transcript_3714/m.7103 type:complete len:176 (-) Transcript_3714:1069-1596(-)